MISEITQMETDMSAFGLLITAVLVLVVFWVLGAVLSRAICPRIEKRIDPEKHPIILLLVRGFCRPISLFLQLAGVCIALLILCNYDDTHLPPALARATEQVPPIIFIAFRMLAVFCIAWGLVASSDITRFLLRNARSRLDLHLSTSVTRFLAAIYKVLVIAIAAVILLGEMNFDVNGLIAGLGLGGLTVALAAQDSAANFFGGLVLITEKPFEIGDWIACNGIEGTVEGINLRSTSIRIASGALTIVPNSTIASSAISNWSGEMKQRRADFTLQVLYSTPLEAITRFTDSVRTLLETDPEIDPEGVVVRFAEMDTAGLGIRVIFYTNQPGFAEHLRIRERINLELMKIAAQQEISFAYPTQTLLVQSETPPGQAPAAPPVPPQTDA